MTAKNDTEVVGGGNRAQAPGTPPPLAKNRGRRFVFTHFPENDTEVFFREDLMKFCEYGVEHCPTTGKLHYQGWMSTLEVHSELSLCKKLKCFVRLMKGNPEENTAYCSKEGNVRKYGELKQGYRGDIVDLVENIKNEKITAEEIALENPVMYHIYSRTFHKVEDIMLRKKFRTWMTTCDWYYGKTGSGKSHKAFEGYNPETHYEWKYDNGWQDGYTGQPIVIINEFRGQIPYHELLSLIDKWPFSIRRRCREPAPFLAKHIIITSSLPPEEIYCNLSAKDDLAQLYRRINLIEKLSQTTFRVITH